MGFYAAVLIISITCNFLFFIRLQIILNKVHDVEKVSSNIRDDLMYIRKDFAAFDTRVQKISKDLILIDRSIVAFREYFDEAVKSRMNETQKSVQPNSWDSLRKAFSAPVKSVEVNERS